MDAVVQDKPQCGCASCRAGGYVLAVERPAGSAQRGLTPWCVSCHHFIMPTGNRSE